jgi:adenylate kinase family enzyme
MARLSVMLSRTTDMVIQIRVKRYIVDDSIVIDLVKKQILSYEKENLSWIIEGFPRTKVQALSLQKIGVIPDKFLVLDVKKSTSVTRVKNNLIQANTVLYGPELEDVAN